MNHGIKSPRTRSSNLGHGAEAQRDQWDSVAAGWRKWWRTIENGAQCVSERLIELAQIEPGQRVLDIATGFGEPALMAARRVGHAGRVVATDISARMLDVARERAAATGVTNVEFIEADAARLDFPDGGFDAVLCRWGLASLPHPAETLIAIRHMLIADGLFATSVWQAGAKGRPLASLAAAVAEEMFDGPSSVADAFSLHASAEHAVEMQMRHAGFTDIRVEERVLKLEFASSEACTGYLMDVSPDLATLLSDKSSVQQADYRQRLGERLQQYVTIDGRIQIENATVCAVGRR